MRGLLCAGCCARAAVRIGISNIFRSSRSQGGKGERKSKKGTDWKHDRIKAKVCGMLMKYKRIVYE